MNHTLELLDCLRDGVLVLRDGRIVEANRTMAEMLGVASAAEFAETELKQWLHPDERRLLADLLAGVALRGAREVRFLTKARETLPLEMSPPSALQVQGRSMTLLVLHDLTARKQLEGEVLRISDRERQRIAHDLHDGLGQHLAAMALKMRALHQSLHERALPEAAEADALVHLLNDATAQTRSLAHGLDPAVEVQSFAVLLEKLARNSAHLFRIACRLVNTGTVPIESAPLVRNLYLVAQEAVNNAIRHGRATDIEIALSSEAGTLILAVRDNGRGLAERKSGSGMGIRIMQHRAAAIGATLEIAAHPEGGTAVICRVRAA